MRILLANKFLRPVGGTESVFFAEWRWLEDAGHTIIPFGMAHPENVASPYRDYWVREVDYNAARPRDALNLLWSGEAAKQLKRLVVETRPDVAHLHNIYHQLTPSILTVLNRAGIPAVMTVHDYKLVCPNYRLYTGDAPCTRCVRSHPWHAVRHRCVKRSITASTLVALETALHRSLGVYDRIAHFIAPGQFAREMVLQAGYPGQRITVLPHGIEMEDDADSATAPAEDAPYFLFAGRLVPEKGVGILLEAAARLSHIPFYFAGEGPETAANDWETWPDNVTYLGKLDARHLRSWQRRARAVLVPSLWYELFGMSALEAMAAGTPVIASSTGALPELVDHERTGLLVPPGDSERLAKAIARLWDDPAFAGRLGRAAQDYVRTHHNAARHRDELVALYNHLR